MHKVVICLCSALPAALKKMHEGVPLLSVVVPTEQGGGTLYFSSDLYLLINKI